MQSRHVSQSPGQRDSLLGYVPVEWEVCRLDQCLTSIDAGKSPDCPDIPAPTGEWGILKVSAVRPEGFRPEENKVIINPAYINSAYEVHDGDLLISRANTYELVGLVCLVQNAPPHLLLCDKTLRLNVDTTNALVKLVFYAMQMPSVRAQIEIHATGSSGSMKNISQETIRRLLIPLPPVSEQRRIVDILETLDGAIRQTEALIAKLKRTKSGLLQNLLTQGLDEQGQFRDPIAHPEEFKDSPLGRIPKGWEAVPIDLIAAYVGSGITPFGGSKVYVQDGVPLIRSQNVTFDGLLLDDVAYIDARTHQSMRRSEIFPHDVLINITGASIGRCCPVPEDLGEANVNQHVCAIRSYNPNKEDARFLSMILASHIGQSQIKRLNAGSNREGINYQQLRAIMVPWPSMSERQQIAAVFGRQDARLRAEEAYYNKLKQLKKGLMHDLLTGQVRIEVEEPSDDAESTVRS